MFQIYACTLKLLFKIDVKFFGIRRPPREETEETGFSYLQRKGRNFTTEYITQNSSQIKSRIQSEMKVVVSWNQTNGLWFCRYARLVQSVESDEEDEAETEEDHDIADD